MNHPLFRGWLLAFALLLTCGGGTGCQLLNQNEARSLMQVQMDVDWKMVTYRSQLAAGNVTLGQKQAVELAYQDFQAAFTQARTAVKGNLNAPSPSNVQKAATRVISLVDGAQPF